MRTRYADIPAYVTKDGSEIRELMHPAHHGNRQQSLAEAIVPPGATTLLHRHHLTEELYHVTTGSGLMTLGDAQFPIGPGDTVLIPPGTPHNVTANGAIPLHILCCCSPAYRHEDTELL
jgi:mannose-6-phosphate isomerase-like protein (cupin superfamily)